MVVFGGTRVACRVCILTKLVLAHDNEHVYQIEMNSAIDCLIDDDASKTLARKISRKGHIKGQLLENNTGHVMLRSTSKPPKMKRRSGPTDGQTDGLIGVLCSI